MPPPGGAVDPVLDETSRQQKGDWVAATQDDHRADSPGLRDRRGAPFSSRRVRDAIEQETVSMVSAWGVDWRRRTAAFRERRWPEEVDLAGGPPGHSSGSRDFREGLKFVRSLLTKGSRP